MWEQWPLCYRLPPGPVTRTEIVKRETATCAGPEVAEPPHASHRCNCCTKIETQVPHQRCSQCQAVWYCSRKCQKERWPDHMKICQAIKELSQREKPRNHRNNICQPPVTHTACKSCQFNWKKMYG